MFEAKDEGPPQPPVEWLFRDAMDAKKDFFEGANVWISAVGTNFLKLRPECANWVMFKRLADPDNAGQFLQPPEDYDFAKYFRDMMGRHQGEVKEVWGEWVAHAGLPPLSRTFHHCQYAKDDEQRAVMDNCGCRGRKLHKYEKYVDWGAADDLTLNELLAIGSTRICGGVSSIPARLGYVDGYHWRRRAYVVTYNRLICSLLGQQRIGMYEAEAWWKNARSICLHKDRDYRHPEARKFKGGAKGQGPKGRGKGQPKGKHQPESKGQRVNLTPRKGEGSLGAKLTPRGKGEGRASVRAKGGRKP